jgi:two-component system sensor histidine kinase FlrB
MAQSLPHPENQTDPTIASTVLADQFLESEIPNTDKQQNLKAAFSVFNELSQQLADSYQHLEDRVAELTSELDYVSEQRYQELQQKEQLAHRLEALINSLPGGVVVLDKQGVIIETNPVAESLLEPEIQGKAWRQVIQHCFAPRDDDGHEVSNRAGRRISIITRSLGEDGQIILLTDQTETRHLQAQLSRNERLSAMGKMVSTLAHQVRTPLSSAMLYANHLCNDTLPAEQHQAFTQKLLSRLHYMERQVRDMLFFVKGEMPLSDKVSLKKLQQSLEEAIEMPVNSYEATCVLEIEAEDCLLQCNLDALIGALLNLVNNSLQAVTNADITIRFSFENVNENQTYLSISVLDKGPGLSAEIEEQIQEMFFTTKKRGTGIGLSVVKVVAQAHGGEFTLSNRNDCVTGGVCACLRLPILKTSL